MNFHMAHGLAKQAKGGHVESSEVEEQGGYKALPSLVGQVPLQHRPSFPIPAIRHVYRLRVCENMENPRQ